ncbi:TetR/AcrR family transcriptional regulator [Oscillibacter sp.]|uniref:TetR/AcrR family transcriptional regulator n=1 Tax=Oscillibacter sp. TaxID=1945593 RepID=UPI001B3F56A5|nr:TetR/AcrR family transcriptional regulator [Oscillibacter sp.]MBP3509733.1 TetR/AcrR family transcriptional regulator [Oscillibacter sp.]
MEQPAKNRILITAARLFQQQGYHATGLNQIVVESGTPKGSLYYYYPGGKEELAIAAIGLIRDEIRERISRFLAGIDGPAEAIQSLIREMAKEFDKPEYIIHCTVSLMTLEVSLLSEPLRLACMECVEAWERAFAEKLEQSGCEAEHSRKLGIMIQSMIDGAMISSLGKRNMEPLLYVAEQIPLLLHGGA